MPAKKIRKPASDPKEIIVKIAKAIWAIFLRIVSALKHILIFLERALKIIAIFVITIAAAVLFVIASLYLFSSTFGLKETPAFQELRDQIAVDFVEALKEEATEKAEMDNVEE